MGRDFTLHGVPVYMLLTAADDAHHHVEDGEDFGVGVYVDGGSDGFVNWTMRNREVDGYEELMAESIARQGEMPPPPPAPLRSYEQSLCALWESWCAAEGLECRSADEMDRRGMDDRQCAFTDAFITIWNTVVK